MARTMARTYRFDVTVHIGALSGQEDVCDLFKVILNNASERLEIRGLELYSFSYDVPEDGLAKIFGYLHVNKTATLYEATVQNMDF